MGGLGSMDLMAVLSTVILMATIATTIFAVGAYVVSRGYVSRRRATKAGGEEKASLGGHQGPAGAVVVAKTGHGSGPIFKRYNPYGAA